MKGVWGISSQWGKTVLLVMVGCVPAEGQTLAGQSTKKGGILARKEKTISCFGRGTDVSQIKQIKVKLMLCYVSYYGRKSIGWPPVFIKYKQVKGMS